MCASCVLTAVTSLTEIVYLFACFVTSVSDQNPNGVCCCCNSKKKKKHPGLFSFQIATTTKLWSFLWLTTDVTKRAII